MSQRRSSQRRRRDSSSSELEAGPSQPQGPNLNLPRPKESARHLFLQSIISHRTMLHASAKAAYKECCRVCGVNGPVDLQTFITELEPGLSLLGLEIKTGIDQEGGGPFVAVVNTVSDATAKIATELAPQQLVFFRFVVDKIMTAPHMRYSVSIKDATKCAKEKDINPAMSFTQAEDLLKALVYKGWLTLHPNRQLTLSPRSIIELGTYLRDKYSPEEDEDLEPDERAYAECQQCLSLVTSGWACPNGACFVRLHRHCAPNALAGRAGKCPASLHDNSACSAQWNHSADRKWTGTPVGLTAILSLEEGDELDESEAEAEAETPRAWTGTGAGAGTSSPAEVRASASQASTAVGASAGRGKRQKMVVEESSEASGEE